MLPSLARALPLVRIALAQHPGDVVLVVDGSDHRGRAFAQTFGLPARDDVLVTHAPRDRFPGLDADANVAIYADGKLAGVSVTS